MSLKKVGSVIIIRLHKNAKLHILRNIFILDFFPLACK